MRQISGHVIISDHYFKHDSQAILHLKDTKRSMEHEGPAARPLRRRGAEGVWDVSESSPVPRIVSGSAQGRAGASTYARGVARSNVEPLLIEEAERQLGRLKSGINASSPSDAQLETIALATAVLCAHIALEARVNRILVDRVGVKWSDHPSIVNEPDEAKKKKMIKMCIDRQDYLEKWKVVWKYFYELPMGTDIYLQPIFKNRESVLFGEPRWGITVLNKLRDTIAHYKGDHGEPFRDLPLVDGLVREARQLIDFTSGAD